MANVEVAAVERCACCTRSMIIPVPSLKRLPPNHTDREVGSAELAYLYVLLYVLEDLQIMFSSAAPIISFFILVIYDSYYYYKTKTHVRLSLSAHCCTSPYKPKL